MSAAPSLFVRDVAAVIEIDRERLLAHRRQLIAQRDAVVHAGPERARQRRRARVRLRIAQRELHRDEPAERAARDEHAAVAADLRERVRLQLGDLELA